MYAVVSLLDEGHCATIQSLWDELVQEVGLSDFSNTPFPHFSYHVAESYPLERLEPVLQQFVQSQSPFRVRATGLGLFTGPHPVVFIPVVRTPELTRFHLALWQALEAIPTQGQLYYHPAHWIPHVTLTYSELCTTELAKVICNLGARDFNWELAVDNISVLYDTGTERGLHARFNLGG